MPFHLISGSTGWSLANRERDTDKKRVEVLILLPLIGKCY